jgi:hypothetical protein
MASPSAVKEMYRRLLQTARRLPGADRDAAVTTIRESFRSGSRERDAAAVQSLLAVAHSKLSYLRMVTPKRAVEERAAAVAGKSRFMVIDGEVREVGGEAGSGGSKKAGWSTFGAGNLDPEHVRRHEASVRRMNFLDRGGGGKRG